MKKLFFSAIPICLVSFILFGISTAILGTKPPRNTSYTDAVQVYEGSEWYIDEVVSDVNEWTLSNETAYVELHTSGVNAYVVQSEDDEIHIRVATGGTRVSVQASCENDELTLKVSPPNVIFDSFADFGKILWENDIFNTNSNVEAVIAFPKVIYDRLDVKHGSGTLMIDGFNACSNKFEIGSGKFEFSKSDQYRASSIELDLGSGSAVLNNAQADSYDIDIGSGHFDINGLSGVGHINMGSGSGSIAYAEIPSDDYGERTVDIGSGTMNLFFPDDRGFELYPSIGSGSISIDAYGIQKKLTSHSESITLGNEASSFYYMEMGSGKVKIKNTSEYSAPVMFSGRPDIERFAVIGEVAIVSSSSQSDVSIPNEAQNEYAFSSMAEDTTTIAPPAAAPEAPKSPVTGSASYDVPLDQAGE